VKDMQCSIVEHSELRKDERQHSSENEGKPDHTPAGSDDWNTSHAKLDTSGMQAECGLQGHVSSQGRCTEVMLHGLDGSLSDFSPSEQHSKQPAEPTASAQPTRSFALQPSPAGSITYYDSAKSDTPHGLKPDKKGSRDEAESQAREEQKQKRESESRRDEEDDEVFARQCQAELDAEQLDRVVPASTEADKELAQKLASNVGDTHGGSVSTTAGAAEDLGSSDEEIHLHPFRPSHNKMAAVASDRHRLCAEVAGGGGCSGSSSSCSIEEIDTWEVESIVDSRLCASGAEEYFVKWKGYHSSENTWEPEENLHCPQMLQIFRRSQATRAHKTPTAAQAHNRNDSSSTPSPPAKRKAVGPPHDAAELEFVDGNRSALKDGSRNRSKEGNRSRSKQRQKHQPADTLTLPNTKNLSGTDTFQTKCGNCKRLHRSVYQCRKQFGHTGASWTEVTEQGLQCD